MKAVFCTKYGGPEVLVVKHSPQPEISENQLLVANKAASITRADTMMRSGTPKFARLFLGFSKPKYPIMGTGFAGIVQAVGSQVKNFKVGDAVFGETTIKFSTNAEFVAVDVHQNVVAKLPKNVSFREAAVVCDGALTSYNFLTQVSQVKSGMHVLINGASGSLGTAAVQLAKILGAKVTAVCSAKNAALVQTLGADEVIDYQQEDFCKNQNMYDIIYDTIGTKCFKDCKKALTTNGQFISPVLSFPLLMAVLFTRCSSQKKAKFEATGLNKVSVLSGYLNSIIPWLENGSLKMVMDKSFAIDEAVTAHAYVDSGRKVGNVVFEF